MSQAVISTIASDRPGLVNELSELIHRLNLNIDDSRMTVLGGEFAVLMMVTGSESAISDLDKQLSNFSTDTGSAYLFRRTEERQENKNQICCRISISAMDHPGIVHKVAAFFSKRAVNIRSIETESQHAAHTGSPIFSLEMLVETTGGKEFEVLKEAFYEFCGDEGLDGELGVER